MSLSRKVVSFFVIIISFVFLKYINFVNITTVSQLNARPIIYGEDFCPAVYQNKIMVTSNVFRRIIDLFTPKTVLHASLEENFIVLKTLVSAEEFDKIEELFYSKFNDKVLHSRNAIEIIKVHIQSVVRFRPGVAANPKFRLCPFSSNIENLFTKLNTDKYLLQDYLHLWTVVQSNPEPLMLKLLQPPKWPVPKYYGSCGRMISVEDCGTILTDFYYTSWFLRVNLTHQLLTSALDFTFQDPDFAYYFTDLSPDNIAVNNLGEVRFIDLEHIVMVDRHPYIDGEDMEDWAFNHTTRHIPCRDCMVFDSDDICQHRLSDHNIYAVCKEILSDSVLFPRGFLHSLPEVLHKNELEPLITDCVEAVKRSRFETIILILDLLNKYLQIKD